MSRPKTKRFKNLADNIIRSANHISYDNPYKNLTNLLKRQVISHQEKATCKK